MGVLGISFLIGLLILCWLSNSKLLKLATLGFVFLYPVIVGQVRFPDPNINSLVTYFEGVIKFWFVQVWQEVFQHLGGLP